ncbi:RlmE family RNA methyltransferase [Kiloniella sp. b19]|uniref:RlmE family RNA methyltransferase n=1 Tax=Kiloniella sp. GXU_MW_B19 TaxID=3141326 RepID=UPI0031DCD5C6
MVTWKGRKQFGEQQRKARQARRGGSGEKEESTFTGRGLKVRVKTARGRSNSSARWLERQLNDPYVAEAKKRGLRSRAAFKLLQIDDRFRVITRAARVVDLGAAPGGWCQVVQKRAGKEAKIVGMDLLEIEGMAGVTFLQGDFMDGEAPDNLKTALGGPADLVISDMAAASSGHPPTDHLRIMGLVEAALEFAKEVLEPKGNFVAKVLQGGADEALLEELRRNFDSVRHFKPDASRKDSSEMYVVALGYNGYRKSAASDQEDGQDA